MHFCFYVLKPDLKNSKRFSRAELNPIFKSNLVTLKIKSIDYKKVTLCI